MKLQRYVAKGTLCWLADLLASSVYILPRQKQLQNTIILEDEEKKGDITGGRGEKNKFMAATLEFMEEEKEKKGRERLSFSILTPRDVVLFYYTIFIKKRNMLFMRPKR